jgi:hypothetical protein
MAEQPEEVPTTPEIVTRISEHIGEGITDEQVNNVLNALNYVRSGDPLGTIKLETATGKVANRVDVDGVHMWRVTAPDGSSYNDMQPTLLGVWVDLTPAGT